MPLVPCPAPNEGGPELLPLLWYRRPLRALLRLWKRARARVAVLHHLRDRAAILKRPAGILDRVRPAELVRFAGMATCLLALAACQPAESDLPPDRRLQSQLGLDPRDRVHEVMVSASATGVPEPRETVVLAGDYLQFVMADSWVHELVFESDSLSAEALAFMTDLDQMASPPMVSRGSRFVVSFVGAPEGRYPFRVEGGHAPAHGAIVVATPADR